MIFDIFYKKQSKKFNKVIFSRNSSVPKCFTNSKVFIHKGKGFKKLTVSKHFIGYKLGEFSFTRKPFFYPKKENKKNKKR